MRRQMEATAGRRLGRRPLLLAVCALAALAGAAALVWERWDDDASLVQPEVELGSGRFEGRDWVYGYNLDPDHTSGLCFWFRMEDFGGGCSSYGSPVETMVVYTSSGGHPEGLLTVQGVASERVARVVCGTGTDPIGETHLFEMPGDAPLRPVLCLGTGDELAGRRWFAFAYDARGRQLVKEEILPRR